MHASTAPFWNFKKMVHFYEVQTPGFPRGLRSQTRESLGLSAYSRPRSKIKCPRRFCFGFHQSVVMSQRLIYSQPHCLCDVTECSIWSLGEQIWNKKNLVYEFVDEKERCGWEGGRSCASLLELFLRFITLSFDHSIHEVPLVSKVSWWTWELHFPPFVGQTAVSSSTVVCIVHNLSYCSSSMKIMLKCSLCFLEYWWLADWTVLAVVHMH